MSEKNLIVVIIFYHQNFQSQTLFSYLCKHLKISGKINEKKQYTLCYNLVHNNF